MIEGKAIIFSAPSGSGKTTIVRHLLEKIPNLQFSISATTRQPRGTEVEGKDYFFMTPEEYHKQEFIESEEVYHGTFYGTLKSEIRRIWENEKAVIFDVDVKGGLNLKRYFGDKALAVFVKVSRIEDIKERLTKRKTESEEDLQRRINKATSELTFADKFDHVLINDQLESALEEANLLVSKFLNS